MEEWEGALFEELYGILPQICLKPFRRNGPSVHEFRTINSSI